MFVSWVIFLAFARVASSYGTAGCGGGAGRAHPASWVRLRSLWTLYVTEEISLRALTWSDMSSPLCSLNTPFVLHISSSSSEIFWATRLIPARAIDSSWAGSGSSWRSPFALWPPLLLGGESGLVGLLPPPPPPAEGRPGGRPWPSPRALPPWAAGPSADSLDLWWPAACWDCGLAEPLMAGSVSSSREVLWSPGREALLREPLWRTWPAEPACEGLRKWRERRVEASWGSEALEARSRGLESCCEGDVRSEVGEVSVCLDDLDGLRSGRATPVPSLFARRRPPGLSGPPRRRSRRELWCEPPTSCLPRPSLLDL
mmetsp:Transcript_57813/g.163143  ORF Transcript_57813/g.163143 Transcript_57813/m.163143 type:complete len:315 (-) Transcript_57813:119-1063(-)